MPTLQDSIKKSIQQYFMGSDIHQDPNAKYTIDTLNKFGDEVNGKAEEKKSGKKAAKPKGNPSTIPSPDITTSIPQGQLPAALKPMKAPNKTSFMNAIQGLADKGSDKY